MSPRRLAHLAAVTHLRESVALVLAAAAVILGITMLADPGAYRVPTFELATAWVAPQGWGVLHVATGGLLAWAVIVDRDSAHLPALMLGIMWAAWSALITLHVATGEGVPSAAVIYTAVSWLAGLVAAGYWLTREDQ